MRSLRIPTAFQAAFGALAATVSLSACGDHPVVGPVVAPGAFNGANIQANGVLAYYQPGNSQYLEGAILHVGPPKEGYFTVRVEPPTGIRGAEWLTTGNYNGSWTGDTLFRPILDRFTFGSTTPGCEFSGVNSDRNYNYFSTTSGSCVATWLETSYRIVKDWIDYPVVLTMTGPDTLIEGGNFSWTASATGGSTGSYYYSFWYKADGDPYFSQLYACTGTRTCSLFRSPLSPSFTLDAFVTTQRHSGAYGTTTVTVGISKHVVMDFRPIKLYPSLTVSVNGPTSIEPYTLYTWYAAVAGGGPPYTYQWYVDDTPAGNDASLSTSFDPSSSHSIWVDVNDSVGHSAQSNTAFTVTVSTGTCPPGDPGCGEYLRVPRAKPTKPHQ